MRDKNLNVEDIKRKYASSGNQIVDLEYAMYFVLLRTNTCSLNAFYTESFAALLPANESIETQHGSSFVEAGIDDAGTD